jgi:hypothetical protein
MTRCHRLAPPTHTHILRATPLSIPTPEPSAAEPAPAASDGELPVVIYRFGYSEAGAA